MGSSDEQDIPLLIEDREKNVGVRREAAFRHWRSVSYVLFAYSILATVAITYVQTKICRTNMPYSVANHLLQTSTVTAHLNGSSILSSSPSHEVHEAWRELLIPSYINASKQEISNSGGNPHTTVKLLDGNYLAVFGVYHQLHCMRWLYYLAHEEVYWSNMTSAQRDIRRDHGKHCIQTIVDYLMCKPDTALYPIALDPKSDNALQLMPGAEWQCVNWDGVHEWAMGRNQGYTPGILAPDWYLENRGKEDMKESMGAEWKA